MTTDFLPEQNLTFQLFIILDRPFRMCGVLLPRFSLDFMHYDNFCHYTRTTGSVVEYM